MSHLYRKVSDQFLEQIASGQRKVGDQLPPEAELAQEFGVSRSTLRMAFNELESGGVLHRQKKSGTKIIAAVLRPQFNSNTTNTEEVMFMIRESVFDIKQVSATLTDDIDFMVDYDCETECWLEVFGSRTRTDETNPICTNRVYIPAHFSGIKSELNNLNISVMQAIEEKYGVLVGRVYGSSRAVACPEREASLLGLATGAPALRADAVLYVQSGEILELTVNHFDTNRFQHFFDVSID